MAKRQRKTLTDQERLAKLKELAPARMSRSLRSIRHVSGLTRYNPTASQKTAMLSALRQAVTNVESAFAGKEEAPEFILP